MRIHQTALLLLCVLLSYALGEIRVGTIVNQDNAFFASKDMPIWQGVNLWVRWTNENGGISIGGISHNLTLITKIVPGGNDTREVIEGLARELAEDDAIDIFIPMFSTERVSWAYPVANGINPNILQCGIGTSVDTALFSGGINWYAVGKGSSSYVPTLVNLVYPRTPRKTFSILYPTESPFYVTLASQANASISAHSDSQVLFYEAYESDRENVDVALLSESLIELKQLDADVFWFANNFADDVVTMTLVMKAQGYTPEAAVLGGSVESYTSSIYTQSNLWISTSQYHPHFQTGVSGIHLGTMEDYSNYHTSLYDHPPEVSWVISASSCGVMLQVAIEVTDLAGKNWQNATEVQEEVKKLKGNETYAQTFMGPIGLVDAKNRNGLRPTAYIQYYKGEMKLLNTPADIVYPAPWPWGEDDDSDSDDVGTTVGIIVGSIVGFLLIMLVVCAIIGVILYVVKRKFYHMIVLPKGNTEL